MEIGKRAASLIDVKKLLLVVVGRVVVSRVVVDRVVVCRVVVSRVVVDRVVVGRVVVDRIVRGRVVVDSGGFGVVIAAIINALAIYEHEMV